MELYLLILAVSFLPFIFKYFFNTTINWLEFSINLIVPIIIVIIVIQLGKYSELKDVEIWNGEITSKNREHGSYIRTYQCNCRTRNKTRTCSTCTENRYTVNWTAQSTVGNILFKHLDSSSSLVYLTPNPSIYEKCEIGQPAAIQHDWTNYVKASKDSLFTSKEYKFDGKSILPSYPLNYDFYKMNRVLNAGSGVSNEVIKSLNDSLNNELKRLGPKKQVNIIVVFTSASNRDYRHSLEAHWEGVKKNDVIVVINPSAPVKWVDIITWGKNKGNEMLQVKLRDDILSLSNIDSDNLTKAVVRNIEQHFKRLSEQEFEYLKEEIDPPVWSIILGLVLAVSCSLGMTYYFHRNEIKFN